MKLSHAAALALVGWYLLTPSLSWAQSHTKTFTAPDGGFSFRYWENLVHCRFLPNGHWGPGDVCWYPICDIVMQEERHTLIACFAYPRNRFTDTPVFEGAGFSVAIVDSQATEKDCLAVIKNSEPPPGIKPGPGTTIINGVSFAVNTFDEGAAGTSLDQRLYRTFHEGKCYQLGVYSATGNILNYGETVRALTDEDENEINGRLEEALKSFRFLK